MPCICRLLSLSKKNFQLGPPTLSLASGASSAGGGCVESCTRQIYWDPIGFRIRWCGFKFGSFDLQFSPLAMVVAMVSWSFGEPGKTYLSTIASSTTTSFV
jgi:hypothetical protein